MVNHLNVRPQTQRRKLDMMESISAYVDAHLSDRITLKDIAAYCNVSVSTVTQTFQRQTGCTFHQFLTQRRIAAARDMILEGTPLEEAGRLVGYGDHSTFYRAFRQTYGISPREFRKNQIK